MTKQFGWLQAPATNAIIELRVLTYTDLSSIPKEPSVIAPDRERQCDTIGGFSFVFFRHSRVNVHGGLNVGMA